jgi:ATP-binding cassette subfamily B protein
LFLTDVAEFFELRPVLQVREKAVPAPRPIREGFRFENVTFRYPGGTRAVLENFDFSITPGERVALVGENGEGKTTIVKLLTRLYDPTSGRILLDGVDLREYDPQSLFREFSILFFRISCNTTWRRKTTSPLRGPILRDVSALL